MIFGVLQLWHLFSSICLNDLSFHDHSVLKCCNDSVSGGLFLSLGPLANKIQCTNLWYTRVYNSYIILAEMAFTVVALGDRGRGILSSRLGLPTWNTLSQNKQQKYRLSSHSLLPLIFGFIPVWLSTMTPAASSSPQLQFVYIFASKNVFLVGSNYWILFNLAANLCLSFFINARQFYKIMRFIIFSCMHIEYLYYFYPPLFPIPIASSSCWFPHFL